MKQRYYHPYTAERLDETVRANGLTCALPAKDRRYLCAELSEPVTDHLAAAQAGQTLSLPRNGCRV